MLHKRGFGSLFINYLYFFLVNMVNWWGFTRRHGSGKKGGLRHRSGSKKRGVLGTVRSKKGIIYCGTYLYWTYM